MADSDADLFGEDDLDIRDFDAVLANAVKPQPSAASTGRAGGASTTAPKAANGAPKHFKQQTLFGGIASDSAQSGPKASTSRTVDLAPPSSAVVAAQQAKTKATKKWDRVKFAQGLPRTGGARPNGKGKGKAKAPPWGYEDEDEEVLDDEEEDDMELLGGAAEAVGPAPEMKLKCDMAEAKTWIYSINKPKRKYQYDIVHRALYNNCLVSLPTGLGKTFIAAVVMLNFYRWYPKGKVLFLAPTRPLVQQQIEACHSIAGIPSKDCVALTGMIPAPRRALAWSSKRVIFSTPQTVENDLRRGRLDPLDVICVVIDEAHRATGGYAYCEVIRLLMQFNSHFRVLALTATPGNDAERVQEVIDSMHIGHIEVRTEDALDVKQYVRQKKIVLELIHLTPELENIRDRWAALMRPLVNMVDFLLYGSKEPAYLSYYAVQQMQARIPKEKQWLRPTVSILAKMTLAMARLLEYSITVGAERMNDLRAEKSQAAKRIYDNPQYKDLMRDLDKIRSAAGFSAHPKMDKMKALILEYLIEAKDAGKEPRLMVFCHFREVVDDIVAFLNQESPMIRASAFVGQSKDSKGHSGMNQKSQQACIKRFKANEFNVLVATSIGEEGLDIGALDCILCYDAQSSPLRTLQRIGRTGRNDDGKVIVLMAEGREERNWDKAKDKYEHVQNALISGKMFELFDDCERLVPQGVKPVCDEREIPVQEYIAEQVEIAASEKRKKDGKATKRKRDGVEDIPANALKGFTSAKNAKASQTKEESLAERATAALLTPEQYEEHLQTWGKDTSLSLAGPAIDLDTTSPDIFHVATDSHLSRANARIRRPLPSQRHATVFTDAESWVSDDGGGYDAWKERMSGAFDERLVIWWNNEEPGKGVKRPFEPCEEIRDPLRRRFRRAPRGGGEGATQRSQLEKELWSEDEGDGHFELVAPKPSLAAPKPQPVPSKPIKGVVARGTAPVKPAHSRPVSSSPLPDAIPRMRVATPKVVDEIIPDSLPGSPDFLPRPTDPDNVLSSDRDDGDVAGIQGVLSRPAAASGKSIVVDLDEDEDDDAKVPPRPQSSKLNGSADVTFGDDSIINLSQGAFDALDVIEGAAVNGRKSQQKAVSVLAGLDAATDHSARPRPPAWAPTSKVDEDVFRLPLHPASRKAHFSHDQSDSSPMPLTKRRKGPPKVRDSYDLASLATQMPFAPGRAANGKRNSVLLDDSEEEEDDDETKSAPAKKLRRADDEPENGEADAPKCVKVKNGKRKKVKYGNAWAAKSGLIELEASESSGEDSKDDGGKRRKKKVAKRALSSSPSIPSEDSDDRAFVAADTSSQTVDQSMRNFYIDSLRTQLPPLPHGGLEFDKAPKRAGALPWTERRSTARRNVMDTSPERDANGNVGQRSDDQWSMGSFVVPDEEIEWDEDASGMLQEGTSDL